MIRPGDILVIAGVLMLGVGLALVSWALALSVVGMLLLAAGLVATWKGGES